MEWNEYAIRLGTALLLGCIVGFERQYHHRMAGLRTNALVALGSASFVMMGSLLPGGEGAARIAAQIVTGIGFLGGGVILRDGLNIRGLNTAATIWCSASIGAMCGAGLLEFAGMSAAGVLGANMVLRPVAAKLSQMEKFQAAREIIYRFQCSCRLVNEARVRELLIGACHISGMKMTQLESKRDAAMDRAELCTQLQALPGRREGIEAVAKLLSEDAAVLSTGWEITSELDIEDSTVGA